MITPPAAAGGECGATHKLAVVIQCVYVQDQYVLPDSHNTELVACEEASATSGPSQHSRLRWNCHGVAALLSSVRRRDCREKRFYETHSGRGFARRSAQME